MTAAERKGANRIAAIPPAILADLNRGAIETRTLAESLAIDLPVLMKAIAPSLRPRDLQPLAENAAAGVTIRMKLAAEIALQRLGEEAGFEAFASHGADTARGIAAHMVGLAPSLALEERLRRIRRFADDAHFGVREWAWLALRPHIAAAPLMAIDRLTPWTGEPSAFLRRFAVEATRPRGVWAAHIAVLKEKPTLGLPLLEPLRADAAPYVQDSVANWLNDAAKSKPDWVRDLCDRWRKADRSEATARIVKRALRSLA